MAADRLNDSDRNRPVDDHITATMPGLQQPFNEKHFSTRWKARCHLFTLRLSGKSGQKKGRFNDKFH